MRMVHLLIIICLLQLKRIDTVVLANESDGGCVLDSVADWHLICTSLKDIPLLPYTEATNVAVVDVECPQKVIPENGVDAHKLLAIFHRFTSLRKVSVVNCSLTEVEEFIFEGNDMLELVDLSNNLIGVLRWQSVAHARSLSNLILINNQLECDCRNEWLKTESDSTNGWHSREVFHLPIRTLTDANFASCTFSHCQHSSLQPLQRVIDAHQGTSVELICDLHGTDELQPSEYAAFEWVYANSSYIHTSPTYIYNNSLKVRVDNITSNEMGVVICKCWSCRLPLFGIIQIRVPTNVSARIVDLQLPELIVHGYPLDELTIEVHSWSSGTHDYSPLLESTSLLNGSLSLRLESEHCQFFVHYYSLYYTPPLCVKCSITDTFEFTICTSHSCAILQQPVHAYHHQLAKEYFVKSDAKEPSTYHWTMTVAILVSMLITISCLSAFLYVKHWMRGKGWKQRRKSRNTEETSVPLEETSLYSSDYRFVPIIDRDAIKLDQKIGQGAFGEVFSADWSGSPTGRVAIKMLCHVEMDTEMGKEAHLLSQLEHPNIVRLFGIARERHRIFLVLELISLGDLKSYVRARVPLCASYSQFPPALTNDELLNISIQICQGLCYLNSQQIVHRDLAARNCLVSGESDSRICDAARRPPFTVKISDFGMSRRLYSQTEYYRMHSPKTILPVRWLAPECIQYGKFTHSSDVWAYGVTIWEVYTYGEIPFGELSNGEVVSAVSNGARLAKPKNAPADLFQIMEDCWEIDPEKRPLSHDVLTRLTLCQ